MKGYLGVIKADCRSLDYSSCRPRKRLPGDTHKHIHIHINIYTYIHIYIYIYIYIYGHIEKSPLSPPQHSKRRSWGVGGGGVASIYIYIYMYMYIYIYVQGYVELGISVILAVPVRRYETVMKLH